MVLEDTPEIWARVSAVSPHSLFRSLEFSGTVWFCFSPAICLFLAFAAISGSSTSSSSTRSILTGFYHERGQQAMDILELENRVEEIRAQPLQLVCVTRKGERRIMGVRECWETGARFLHVAADDLDGVLGVALGGDAEYP